MPKFSWRFFCWFFLLIVASSPSLLAGLVDEHSWSEESANGKFLLVMTLTEDWVQKLKKQGYSDNDRQIEIRRKYPECGIYRNDGSVVPLWTLPYEIQLFTAYISNDGKHVLLAVEETDHTSSNIAWGAQLCFYHHDGTIQSWAERELTWGWGLKFVLYNLLDIYQEVWTDVRFKPSDNTYSITTDTGQSFVFDITTGQMISSSSLWNKGLVAFFVAVPLCIYFILRQDPGEATTRSLMRFSVKRLLVAMTVVGMWFWLLTVNWVLAVAVIVPIAIGGGISRLCTRKPRAWITGTLLAIYGCVWGMFLWAILIEPIIWKSQRFNHPYIWLLPAFVTAGLIGGGIIAGILERRTNTKLDSLRSSATSC
jgi:hypothetical protein